MRISNSAPKATPASQPAAGFSADRGARASQSAAGAPTDRLQLSSLSTYLASALSGSPAHTAQLADLSAALVSGQYQVDAYTVGGDIIQHSIEFGSSGYSGLRT
jgi:anti-sigma28 factor (negative regulator of flagellin synthesis)